MAEHKDMSSPPPGHPVWKAPADAEPQGFTPLIVENRGAPVADNVPGPARPRPEDRPRSTVFDPDALNGPAWNPGADTGEGSRLVDKIMAEQFGADTSGHRWRYVNPDRGRVHKTFADTHFGLDPARFPGDAVFEDRNGNEFMFAWLPVPGGLPMKGWAVRHGAFGKAPAYDMDLALGILEVARHDPALSIPSLAPSANASKEARDITFLAAMRLNIEDAVDAVREGRPAQFFQMNYQPEPAIQAQYEAMFNALGPEEKQAFELARCKAMSRIYAHHGLAEKAQYYTERAATLEGKAPEAPAPEAPGGATPPPSPPSPPPGPAGGGGAAPARAAPNDDTAGQPAREKTEPMPPRQPAAPTVVEIPASQVEVVSRPAPTVVSGEIVPRERTVITVPGESVPSSASPLARSSFAGAAPRQLPEKTPPALPPKPESGGLPPPSSGPKRLGPPSP